MKVIDSHWWEETITWTRKAKIQLPRVPATFCTLCSPPPTNRLIAPACHCLLVLQILYNKPCPLPFLKCLCWNLQVIMQENLFQCPRIHPKELLIISHIIYLSLIQLEFVKCQKLNTTAKPSKMYTRFEKQLSKRISKTCQPNGILPGLFSMTALERNSV